MFRRFAIIFSIYAGLVAAPAYATMPVHALPDLAVLQMNADKGDTLSQNHLAVIYAEGHGVEQDYQHAALWFKRAAERGSAYAQFSLGTLYSMGLGLPRDYKKAASWYGKAARQNDIKAQYHLGVMYYKGIGVKQDASRGTAWLLKAAEAGDKEASNYLQLINYRNQRALQQIKSNNSLQDQFLASSQQEAHDVAGTSLGVIYLQGLGITMTTEALFLWIVLPILCMLGLLAL